MIVQGESCGFRGPLLTVCMCIFLGVRHRGLRPAWSLAPARDGLRRWVAKKKTCEGKVQIRASGYARNIFEPIKTLQN